MSLPRRPQEPVRRCTLALRSMPITLNPPQAKKRRGKVAVWAILATEATPQPKGETIEWLLLRTLPTSDVNDVIERVHWCTCGWTIEVWHRVLKTGCRIESRQLETVERIADRADTLFHHCLAHPVCHHVLAQTDPDLPCTVVLNKEEWQALYCNIQRVPEPATTPPTLA